LTRHCLRIPFLIGQRDDSIIGNACADNPAWGVPCNPVDFGEVTCDPSAFPEDVAGTGSFSEGASVPVTLAEPAERTVTFA
jgi:hypothetical protein